MTPVLGMRVVLRGLPVNAHAVTATLPTTIGLIVCVDPLRASLRRGNNGSGARWTPKPRRIKPENVVREATPRECATGFLEKGND